MFRADFLCHQPHVLQRAELLPGAEDYECRVLFKDPWSLVYQPQLKKNDSYFLK